MSIRSTTDPERFRVQYYGGRRYIDPLPADGTWEPTGPKEKLWNCTGIAKAIDTGQFWKKLNDQAKAPLDAIRAADHVNANIERLMAMSPEDRRIEIAMSAPADLDRAAKRGRAVHELIEGLLRGESPLILEADAEPYQAIAEQVAADIAGMVDTMEAVAFGRRSGLPLPWGGTYDAFHSSGSLLVDYKSRGADSSHGCYPKEVAQLGLGSLCDYYITQNAEGEAVRMPMPDFDELLLISIKPDSYEVFPVSVTEARDAAMCALDAHVAQKEGQRLSRAATNNPRPTIAAADPPQPDPSEAGVEVTVEDTTATGGPSPDPERLAWFSARYDEVRATAGPNAIKAAWPESLSTPAHRDEWSAGELDRACAVIQMLHHRQGLDFPPQDPQVAKLRRKPRATDTLASDDEHAETVAAYKALPQERQDRVIGWQAQGNQVGRSWEAPSSGATRWAITVNRAAIALAGHTNDDDIARAWIALVIGDDDAQTFPPGALLGSLTVTEAQQLAELASTSETFAAAIAQVDSAA